MERTVRYICVRGDGWRANFAKERWIHEKNYALPFWMLMTAQKKRENQHKRTTRHPHTRDAKCTEAVGGIFAHLSWPITILSNKSTLYPYDVISRYCIFLCWIFPWKWPEKRPKHVGWLPHACKLLYPKQCSCWNTDRHSDLSVAQNMNNFQYTT
jgi:hypothetical protein